MGSWSGRSWAAAGRPSWTRPSPIRRPSRERLRAAAMAAHRRRTRTASPRRDHQLDTWSDQSYDAPMRQIGAAKFKEQCLALMDRVGPEGIVITKRGRPVAKLIPIRAESSVLIGSLRGRLKVKGSILSTGLSWDAQP